MKRPQRELSIGVWVDFGRILARKPVAGVLGSTVLISTLRYLSGPIAHTPFKYPGSGGGSLCARWVGTHQHPAIPNFDSEIGYRLLDF